MDLASINEEYWFHLGGPTVALAALLDETFDEAALDAAVVSLRERHLALRCRFVLDEHSRVLRVPDEALRPLTRHDAPGRSARAAAGTVAKGFRFSATDGPLWEIAIVRSADGPVLVTGYAHLVADAQSAAVLLDELSALYRQHRAGRHVEVTEDMSLRRFADQQNERFRDPAAAVKALAFHEGQLHGSLTVRTATAPGAPIVVRSDLSAGQHAALKSRADASRVAVFPRLLAAAATATAASRGIDDVLMLVTTGGRLRPEFARTVGELANGVPFRVERADQLDAEQLALIASRWRQAFAHQSLPLSVVVAAHPEVVGFSCLVSYWQVDLAAVEFPPSRVRSLDGSPFDALGAVITPPVLMTPLTVYLVDQPDGSLGVELLFRPDVTDEQVAAAVDAFRSTVAAA